MKKLTIALAIMPLLILYSNTLATKTYFQKYKNKYV